MEGDISLLHIDGEPQGREIVQDTLDEGCDDITVHSVRGANEGLEHLKENPQIDCIMCAYTLPGMDALELFNFVSSQLGLDIPCILFARHGDATAAQAVNNGADEYFNKEDVDREEIKETLVNRIRKLVERQRAMTELERQNQRLEDFASAVSHDLRNPLNVARGRAELVQQECDSENIDTVVDSLERMESMIEDMLKLARGDRQEVEPTTLKLDDFVSDCWNQVDTLDATLQVEDSVTFDGDRSRLQRVFGNLFRNAIEHGGDSVTVRVGTFDGGIFVADNGPGIPPDRRQDVFEQGYTTNEDGTGFGLRFVKDIIEAHGWEIEAAESESGGARFNIYLPNDFQQQRAQLTDFS